MFTVFALNQHPNCCNSRAPRYIVKNLVKATPDKINTEYKNQKHIRVTSARKQQDTHPEPKTVNLLPLRPKSCKPNIRTTRAQREQKYEGPTPKVHVYELLKYQ